MRNRLQESGLERWREKRNRNRLQDSGAAQPQHSKFPNFLAWAAMMVPYSPMKCSPLSSKGLVVVTLQPGRSMCPVGCPNLRLHHAGTNSRHQMLIPPSRASPRPI